LSYNHAKWKGQILTSLSPPLITIVPYADSLNADETPSNSASHPDPCCSTLKTTFLWATLKHF